MDKIQQHHLDRVSFPSFLVAWKQWRWDHLKFETCRWSNHRQGLHLRQLGLKLHCSHLSPGFGNSRENGPGCCQLCQTRWHEFQVLKQHHEELRKWNRIIHQPNQETETSKYPIPPINTVRSVATNFWPWIILGRKDPLPTPRSWSLRWWTWWYRQKVLLNWLWIHWRSVTWAENDQKKRRFLVANQKKWPKDFFFTNVSNEMDDWKGFVPESDGELGHPKLEDGTPATLGVSYLIPLPKESLGPFSSISSSRRKVVEIGETEPRHDLNR